MLDLQDDILTQNLNKYYKILPVLVTTPKESAISTSKEDSYVIYSNINKTSGTLLYKKRYSENYLSKGISIYV